MGKKQKSNTCKHSNVSNSIQSHQSNSHNKHGVLPPKTFNSGVRNLITFSHLCGHGGKEDTLHDYQKVQDYRRLLSLEMEHLPS